MKRQVLAISMRPKMAEWVRLRVAYDEEFVSISDYIRELIKNDQKRLERKAAIGPDFESLLLPGTVFTNRLR